MIKTTILIFLSVSLISCSKDTIDGITKEQTENTIANEPENTITTPCNFNLSNIEEGEVISIDCLLDLKGKEVSIPKNVTINFNKGDIVNGTLNFTNNGKIDGRLLNSSLIIKGSSKLISTTFHFFPSRWGITEGKTTKEIALLNRKNINKAIETIERLKGSVFVIGKMDAYFNVEANKINRKYHSDRSIRVPSNFHLKMSNDSFLRVQPTHFPSYSLITTFVKDNATISGGNLIGDRWEHDYTPINDIAGVNRDDHGYGFLIYVIGSHNTTINNVNISEAVGDGIIVHAETIRNPNGELKTGTRTSEKIIIKNCLITECRRNNIAVVDAKGVIIDDCDILNTGKGEQAFDTAGNKIFSSSGTAPRYGIDLEALRYINNDGTINEINKIEDVIIKNSRFKGNAAGDIDIYTVSKVIIENNFFDKWVANFASNDVIIRDNIFESRNPEISFGINIQSFIRNGTEFNFNYTITNNTITGYRDGIKLAGINQTVNGNKINNCVTGLQLNNLSDSKIFDNRYTSNLNVSYGINPFPNSIINNVTLTNEYINVINRPLNFRGVNKNAMVTNNQLTINNCELYTNSKNFKLHIKDSKNITIKNSKTNTSFEIINSVNIIERDNTIIN